MSKFVTINLCCWSLAFGLHLYNDRTEASPASCSVIDGDTLNCDGERIRLNGIDAPEMPGHCRIGHDCVDGDPFVSKLLLIDVVKRGPIRIERLGADRYGRTIAEVTAGGVDLSCEQLRTGSAEYVERWDEDGRTAVACGL